MVPAQLPHIAGVLDPERATEIDIREVDLIVRFQLRNYNAGCTACASMTFDESLLDRPAPQQRKAPSPRHETVRSVEIDHLPSAIGKCNGSRLYGFEPAARGRWASVVHIVWPANTKDYFQPVSSAPYQFLCSYSQIFQQTVC
jgi:hypothetical protein